MRLEKVTALITGASSGIGEATARALAGRRAAVALVARRRDRLEKLAAEIEERGGSALVIQADVAQQEQAEAAVQRTVDEMGRLDILVNDAGVVLLGPALDAPADEWSRMVSVNVLGLLCTTHAALSHLVRAAEDSPRRVADLVNVGSVAGREARAGAAVYNLTKFGVRGPRSVDATLRGRRTAEGSRHRTGHRVHRDPPTTRRGQRALGPPDRTGGVTSAASERRNHAVAGCRGAPGRLILMA
jgi:NADP-dependent 3-hydroxy acid dehydrogenase YdfG